MTDNIHGKPFSGSREQHTQYDTRIALDCILPLMERWGIDVRRKSVCRTIYTFEKVVDRAGLNSFLDTTPFVRETMAMEAF